jgi:hypothetical protein
MSHPKLASDAVEVALAKVLSSAACRGRPTLRRLLAHLVQEPDRCAALEGGADSVSGALDV